MDSKFAVALAGCLALILGVFSPLLHVPVAGHITYFQNGRGDGVIILVVAVVGLIATFARQYRLIPLLGVAALLITANTFYNINAGFGEARAQLDRDLADNPFRGFADAAMGAVQMQWGWGVLLVGAVLLIAVGVTKRPDSASNNPNPAA